MNHHTDVVQVALKMEQSWHAKPVSIKHRHFCHVQNASVEHVCFRPQSHVNARHAHHSSQRNYDFVSIFTHACQSDRFPLSRCFMCFTLSNNVLGSHAGLTSFSWGHESVIDIAAAIRRCCLARRMLPWCVSLALSLVLVLMLARLPVPLLIPVLAPAVWADEHQHVFSRFFDLGYLGYPKRSMPGFGSICILNARRGKKRD